MEKLIKEKIKKLKPSATIALNEKSKKLISEGKKIYKFGFGQSPFPVFGVLFCTRNYQFPVSTVGCCVKASDLLGSGDHRD